MNTVHSEPDMSMRDADTAALRRILERCGPAALVEPADGVPLERRASLVDHIVITPAGKEQAHGKV